MSLAPADERELLEPLYAGMLDPQPWREFLRRLASRTGAELAVLQLRGPGGMRRDCWSGGKFPAVRATANPAIDPAVFAAVMRPLRVYALAEIFDTMDRATRAEAEAVAAAAGIAHARGLRVPTTPGGEALLSLGHSSRDFAAADSALLSSLGPHVAAALRLAHELDQQRRRAELAEDALAALGASQALIDTAGRVVATDPRRLGPWRAEPGQRLVAGAHAGARAAAVEAATVVPDPAEPERTLLLRPAPPSAAVLPLPGGVAALTRASRPDGAAIARALAQLHGLSEREAQLAAALSDGAELVPAGLALGLTAETTRNYSKRIYAKTGARGQADLVRLVLSGVAPFAGHPSTRS